jgi:acyl-CoA synthetase (AMP-forming)/AMP-acid ligase II
MNSSPWRPLLYDRLRDRPYPLTVWNDGCIVPAASLWAGTRLWTAAFREAGLAAGERIVLALPPSPGFVCALLAGLWEGLTIALADSRSDLDAISAQTSARIVIADAKASPHFSADPTGLPIRSIRPLLRCVGKATPDARLLLLTSGTAGSPRWIALSDENVLSVLHSHGPLLGLSEARVLSVLPWRHVFGLVIELLPTLLAGAEIVREPSGGRDQGAMLRLMAEYRVTHLSGTPLIFERLIAVPDGFDALRRLRGGVVGGAPIRAKLATALAETRLRVGYGQTEASPGICLGEPGEWPGDSYLGRPLGCEVRIDDSSILHFSGPNACLGIWEDGRLHTLDPNRWVDTRDIVRKDGDRLFFIARADDAFKMANGRFVAAGVIESAVRAQFPGLHHVLVDTIDGRSLILAVSAGLDSTEASRTNLEAFTEKIRPEISDISVIADTDWKLTPKGEVDRRAMNSLLRARAI